MTSSPALNCAAGYSEEPFKSTKSAANVTCGGPQFPSTMGHLASEQVGQVGIVEAALFLLPFVATFVALASFSLRPGWSSGWAWPPLIAGVVAWLFAMAFGVVRGDIRAAGLFTAGAARCFLTISFLVAGPFSVGFCVGMVGEVQITSFAVWALAGAVIGAVPTLGHCLSPRKV